MLLLRRPSLRKAKKAKVKAEAKKAKVKAKVKRTVNANSLLAVITLKAIAKRVKTATIPMPNRPPRLKVAEKANVPD